MIIATFNVNSVKARLPRLLEWLDEAKPDVVLLQEIKTITEDFPALEFEERGYQVEAHGQKTYNGVAILSKFPMTDILRGLPGNDDDPQARYIEATIEGKRVVCIYLPNGNPVLDDEGALHDKFTYKLRWMDHLIAHMRDTLLTSEQPVIIGGDYNLIPDDRDVYDPDKWQNDALCRPESRKRFRHMLNLGFTEAFRAAHPAAVHVYSYWDYVRGRWQKDEGLRIDHFLLSPRATDLMQGCFIDKDPRGKEKASDHTPVLLDIA